MWNVTTTVDWGRRTDGQSVAQRHATAEIATVRDALPHVPPGTWHIDPQRSEIAFRVRHLGLHMVGGVFRSFSGTIVTRDEPTRGSATASVDLSSLDSGSALRDKHLRSAELLDVENHGAASYESLAVSLENDVLVAEGLLHLFSRSRPLKFAVDIASVSAESLVFTAQTEFSRRDIGLKLRVKPGVLDRAVSDKVALRMRIVAHPHSPDGARSSDSAHPDDLEQSSGWRTR
jgi:polyisoprenoid-binding protein YceI